MMFSGLDVPMNDAGLVRSGESAARLDRVIQHLRNGERSSGDLLAESLAIDEFGGDVGGAVGVPNVVDGDDVGVVESGSGAGLLGESKNSLGVLDELGGKVVLQCDFAIEAGGPEAR